MHDAVVSIRDHGFDRADLVLVGFVDGRWPAFERSARAGLACDRAFGARADAEELRAAGGRIPPVAGPPRRRRAAGLARRAQSLARRPPPQHRSRRRLDRGHGGRPHVEVGDHEALIRREGLYFYLQSQQLAR